MALFPSAGSKPLFPSAVPSSSTNDGPAADVSVDHDQSWLQNPSFSNDTAKELHRLYTRARPETEGGEKKPLEDESYSTSSSSEGSKSVKRRKKERKKDERRHHKHRKVGKHHKSRREDSVERGGEGGRKVTLESAKPQTVWIDESGLNPKDAYRIDHKPDGSNLHYTSLYSGDVASYRRNFGSHCLGLGRHQAIEWTDGRTRVSKKQGRKGKPMRYFRGEAGSSLKAQPEIVLCLSEQKVEKGGGSSVRESTQEEEFLSLQHKTGAPNEQPGSPPPEVTPEMYISQRTGQYNRSLLEDPHNVPLWLEFIAFQDEALLWGKLPTIGPFDGESSSSGTSEGKRKTQKAILERKLAIYERAIETNPLSVDLLVGHMDLVAEIWEAERVLKKWKDIIFKQPNKPRLWLSYVEFCQSRFSSFTVCSLSSLFAKALSTLSSIQDGRLKSHRPDPDTPSSLLTIFTLYCSFLRQTGYSEKAVACFQGLIEFNLCCPAELDSADIPVKDRIEFFEAFWDSGTPRFGEVGAMRWSNWFDSNTQNVGAETKQLLGVLDLSTFQKSPEGADDPGASDDSEVDPEISLISGLSLPTAWVKLEQQREREGSLPWRPDVARGESEEDCTDPDRMVLFDDVRPSLFRITDPTLQLQLFLSFLHFLGAPLPSPPSLPPTLHLASTCLTSPTEVFAAPSSIIRNLLSSRPLRQLPTTHQLLGIGYGYEQIHNGSLVELVSGASPTPSSDTDMQPKRSHETCNFIANVCNQSLSLFLDCSAQTSIVQVWLHHEFSLLARDLQRAPSSTQGRSEKQKIKTMQKLVKSLLRLESHRNNLSLWNCCALLEHLVGNYSEAVRLYETVLSQSSPGTQNESELANLYRCFCECVLWIEKPLVDTRGRPDLKLALHALVCLAEGRYEGASGQSGISPARLLKAKTVYEKTWTRCEQDLSTPGSMIACHAYFEYLMRGLNSACSVLERYTHLIQGKLDGPSSRGDTVHNLHTAYFLQSRLIVHHSTSHPIQPAKLRVVLEQSLTLFPYDGWFLAAYCDCEQQSFISGRLRRYFDSRAPKDDTPFPWLFAVRAELQRYGRLRDLRIGGGESYDEPETGILHRIGALLKRATESNNGRHCPLLWRLLMKFEMEHHGPLQAKAVFYKAIQQCPWAKVLYVDAVQCFPNDVDGMMEIVEEKGLRLRAPIEEVSLLLETARDT